MPTPYLPFRTLHDIHDRGRSAKREIAKWRNLHPTNVEAKVQIILDHFTRNVLQRNLLDGHAKAMIVTSSRAAAVKYHLTLERFVRENPVAYASVKSLVAFSEEVSNLDVKDAGYTAEKRFTEANLNPGLSAGSLPDVFDGPAHNVLIVANKYQTGFDQPKLVAMYVDKALSGVEAVQTLSRLNRTMRGKDQTFILDFTNKDEEILRAFKTYYRKAEIDAPQDPSVVYDLQQSIYQQDIFTRWDIQAFMESFEKGAPTDKTLLSQLLEQLSQQLDIPEDEAASIIHGAATRLSKDEVVRAQMQRNTPEQMMAGDFPDRTRTALANSFSQFGTALNTLFRDEKLLSLATRAVLETVRLESRRQG